MDNSVENDHPHLVPVDGPGLRQFHARLETHRYTIKGALQILASNRDVLPLFEQENTKLDLFQKLLTRSQNNLQALRERFDQSYRNKKVYCDSISTRLKYVALGKQGAWIIKSTEIHAAHTGLLREMDEASALHETRARNVDDAEKALRKLAIKRDKLLQTQDRFDTLCLTLFGQGESPWPEQDDQREDIDAAVDALHSCGARINSLNKALELLGQARTLLQNCRDEIDNVWLKKNISRPGPRALKKINYVLGDV